MRALAADREAPAVPDPLICPDLDLPLDVLGHVGFKGSRKSTPFAAQLAAEKAARQAQ